jgi:hypothetical protein
MAGWHDLLERVMIALCTVRCGGEDCTDVAELACTKLAPLRDLLSGLYDRESGDAAGRDGFCLG